MNGQNLFNSPIPLPHLFIYCYFFMLPQENEEENDEDIVGDDWMKAPLTFESDGPVLAKDASSKVVIRRRKNQL